ncbi:O-antigen ligase family protein [Flavivirga jejuensis]|uniref:O-antigen ligase-related domain-containing protein n=1 Tax=Flavivirga jejuensis TaxID=870487 RepID=A0ABT8WT65_9FLAO|nr:O-antigen ligase family protein [Flavivirga jejuensis]MDO5976378.1 hypothetical protein [Flavivirga jejuensis]
MIIALLFFYAIALILAVKHPNYFLVYYLLATTKFLGFIDPSSFIIGGVEIGYFGLNIIAIISVFFQKGWYIMPKKTQWFIYFILLMLAYGIIKPFLDNNSSLYLSFMASKETWFYFLFLYMIVYRDRIDNKQLLGFIKFIGIYLSLIYIIGKISLQFVPPVYYNESYVRTFFPTYISLTIFIYAIKIKFETIRSMKDRVTILLLFLGVFFAAHLSLTIMTFIGFILYKYVYDKRLELNKYIVSRFIFITFIITSIALISISGLYEKIVVNVEAIITGEDTSLNARDIYNEFRWEAINKQKNLGYGFIHQSSSFMKEIKISGSNRFMERFTVIDSGYVDLLIKFGYIGTILLILVLIIYYSRGFLKSYKNPLSLAMSIYLMQYVFINYTWSVFTFAHGIVPGVIAFHFLLSSNEDSIEKQVITNNIII